MIIANSSHHLCSLTALAYEDEKKKNKECLKLIVLELIASKVDHTQTARFHSAALFLTNALWMHDHMTPPDGDITAILHLKLT